MPTGYSRSPKLLKGAFVKLSEDFLGPIPNVIVFQYNPQTITRDLMPSGNTMEKNNGSEKATRSEPFKPGEKFNLKLELDATDALEEPEMHPVAVISGIGDRIAAMELLLYPVNENEVGKALSSLFSSKDAVPRSDVPVVLFIWGPGRILPVRLTSFSVEEQEFSPTLFPIKASVTIGLQVFTEESFSKPKDKRSTSEKLAITAYRYTLSQKEALARANLANSAESILGMLPFL